MLLLHLSFTILECAQCSTSIYHFTMDQLNFRGYFRDFILLTKFKKILCMQKTTLCLKKA